MKNLLCILLTLSFGFPTAIPAQDAPPGYTWQCNAGVCRLVRIAQPIVSAPIADPRIDALSQKIDRLASTLAKNGTISQAEYETFAPEPLPVAPISFASYQSPVQAIPVTNTVTGTTCNCALTGVCTCDPALCRCAACANGSVNMGLSQTYGTSSYYDTSYANTTVTGGRIRPRRAARHAGKAVYHQHMAAYYSGN